MVFQEKRGFAGDTEWSSGWHSGSLWGSIVRTRLGYGEGLFAYLRARLFDIDPALLLLQDRPFTTKVLE